MTVAALTGMIPIVVAGGLVLKFTEAGMPVCERRGRKRRTRRYYSKKQSTSSQGDFGNVGF